MRRTLLLVLTACLLVLPSIAEVKQVGAGCDISFQVDCTTGDTDLAFCLLERATSETASDEDWTEVRRVSLSDPTGGEIVIADDSDLLESGSTYYYRARLGDKTTPPNIGAPSAVACDSIQVDKGAPVAPLVIDVTISVRE